MEWQREWTAPTIAGVVSFGIGVAVGYAFKTYQNKIMQKIDEQLTELHFDMQETKEEAKHSKEVGWKTYAAVQDKTPEERKREVEADVWNAQNVFQPESDSVVSEEEEEEDDWDYDVEVPLRTPDVPYIIHRNEYEEEEPEGYSQSTLTYYAGDDVLTDELDKPVYDVARTVGTLQFGKGSQDPNVCYIRNDRLEAEYEVLLDHGLYQVEILGQEIEHNYDSKKPPLYKFRD